MDKNKQNLLKMRHSAEHVLTQAMENLWPGKIVKAMGPATEDGFYFDFETKGDLKINEDDFGKIEKEMQRLVKAKLPIVKKVVSESEARELFADNEYKLEWIEKAVGEGEEITVYWTGEEGQKDSFVDLCAGHHVENTGEIGAFKLLSVAGAYWHGDEKNKMLTRVYGTSFENKLDLGNYLDLLAEAKKRDHRKLGHDLGLFVFSETVGKGLPIWTPKGSTVRRILERYVVDEEIKRGYQHVYTPDIANLNLYKKSGHYPYYKDSMYAPIEIDEEEYMLRPMTCPHHFEYYLTEQHSYKDLPMRIAELAKLYRYEKSGELSGLLRVRSFCLADAHIICRENQTEKEINGVLDLIENMVESFGLKKGVDYTYRLSLGDRTDEKKYFKDDKAWDFAEGVLRKVLKDRKADFYEAENEAAFYGPKIDIQMKNVLGKEDTAFTVQYDFVMPKRFKLDYINEDGKVEETVVIHRSSIGAVERTMAFLIEFYAGAFPVWLAPVQVEVLPISEKVHKYAMKVKDLLAQEGVRVELSLEAESLGKKIRKAESNKVPYMLIVGEKEAENKQVSVRSRGQRDLGVFEISDFVKRVVKEDKEKSLVIE